MLHHGMSVCTSSSHSGASEMAHAGRHGDKRGASQVKQTANGVAFAPSRLETIVGQAQAERKKGNSIITHKFQAPADPPLRATTVQSCRAGRSAPPRQIGCAALARPHPRRAAPVSPRPPRRPGRLRSARRARPAVGAAGGGRGSVSHTARDAEGIFGRARAERLERTCKSAMSWWI